MDRDKLLKNCSSYEMLPFKFHRRPIFSRLPEEFIFKRKLNYMDLMKAPFIFQEL